MLINSYRFAYTAIDADAAVYIAAVQTADGQPLEYATAAAIDMFIIGCKTDGIWTAIKASCILAGARTLAGALVPLVGTAPTNVGPFVISDYNRKTGLKGNASTKYINAIRSNNADPQNNQHLAVYVSTLGSSNTMYASSPGGVGQSYLYNGPFYLSTALHGPTINEKFTGDPSNKVFGISRNSETQFTIRVNAQSYLESASSQTPIAGSILIFAMPATLPSALYYSDARLAFYSIGESLNLALLDTRVTALINAISTAF